MQKSVFYISCFLSCERWEKCSRGTHHDTTKLITAALTTLLTVLVATPAVAAVPEFDPSASQDLDRYEGSERPDETEVMDRFNQTFEAIDRCVEAERKRTHEDHIDGLAHVDVLLDPEHPHPLGVNANTDGKKRSKLRGCLRNAVGSAEFPTYHGPPVVVNFEFEIDPGYEEE